MKKGFFRGTVAKRNNEDPMAQAVGSLSMTVRGLWGLIKLLETRKVELEREIKAMENYMQQGMEIIERDFEK